MTDGRTDGQTDGQTDGRTDGGDCNIPNAFLKKRGDNNCPFLPWNFTKDNSFVILSLYATNHL